MTIHPHTEHGIIWHNPNSFFRYSAWPSVCKDEEGVLYVVCSGFRAAHCCPFGKTVMFKSWDEGQTWSIPMIINDTWLDDRDGGIICLGGKKLLVNWFDHPVSEYTSTFDQPIRDYWAGSGSVLDMYHTIPASESIGGAFVRVSNDGGMTWGPPVTLPVHTPHGPILKKDGSLLYMGKEYYSYNGDIAEKKQDQIVTTWESRDNGMTWQRLGGLDIPDYTIWDNFHEPHMVELDDGRILGILRAQGTEVVKATGVSWYTMYQTYSDDGGKTWSKLVPMGISGCPPHLLKHSSGAVVMVYGRREAPFGERAMITWDGGKTWSDEIVLCETTPGDMGYPASVELSDGSILTVYYQQYENEGFPSILYTKWNL